MALIQSVSVNNLNSACEFLLTLSRMLSKRKVIIRTRKRNIIFGNKVKFLEKVSYAIGFCSIKNVLRPVKNYPL